MRSIVASLICALVIGGCVATTDESTEPSDESATSEEEATETVEQAVSGCSYSSYTTKGSCGECGAGKARYQYNVWRCCNGHCSQEYYATWCDYC